MATLLAAIEARSTRGAAAFARDANKVSKSALGAGASIRTMDGRMRSAGLAAGGLRRTMVGLLAGFTAFVAIRTSTKTLAEFESTMVLVGAVAQATSGQLEALTAVARDFGATTRFTAVEAGQGLLFLARAGFTVQASIEALPATLNLAQVGMLSLGRAADFASNIVTQFGLEAAETVRVVDSLIIASNRSNTSVSQAADAMKFAGTVLGQLGVQVEDAANLIGVLGDRGIQASLAGTNLRTSFLKLQAPTASGIKALAKYGLSVQDVNVQTTDFIEVFEKLRPLLRNSADAVKLFGLRNIAAAQTIAGSTEKLKFLREEQRLNRGEAERIARVMDDTLTGAFKELISTMQEAILAAGDAGLLKAFKGLTTTLTGTIRVLTGTTRVTEEVTNASIILASIIGGLTVRFVALKLALVALKLETFVLGFVSMANAAKRLGLILTSTTGLLGLAAAAGAALFVSIDAIARSMEEAGRAVERFSLTMEKFRRGTIRDMDAAARAAKEFEIALEFGDLIGQTRALQTQLRIVSDEATRLAEGGAELGFAFKFADVAEILPPESLQKLADNIGIDLEQALRGAIVERGVLQRILKEAAAELEGQILEIKAQIEIAADGDIGIAAVLTPAERAAEQIKQLFSNLVFEQTLVGKSRDEIERLRAVRSLEALAIKAESTNVMELTSALTEQITALQKLESDEEFRLSRDKRLAKARQDAEKRVRLTIRNLKLETELIGLNTEQRNRAILMQRFEIEAVGLLREEREKLLTQLLLEADAFDAANKKNEKNLETIKSLGEQTSDIIRRGIVDAIDGYKSLGDVAEDVFKQIKRAAIQNAVFNAFGSGSFFGGGGTANGAASGMAFSSTGNVLPGLARGGIISDESFISTRQGIRPVAEGGRPEAVMPLARTSSGKLGVEIAGDKGTQTLIMNINGVTDVDGFKRNERQIMARANRALTRRGA